MAYSGLTGFIADLEKHSELHRIETFVDPVLEIAEVTDRISKSGGKALLFGNTGTAFPVLINAFGSARRITMALGRQNIDDAAAELSNLFDAATGMMGPLLSKIAVLPRLGKIAAWFPSRSKRKGLCQQHVISTPDLSLLPVLKCWPHDGGRFFTLPVVHTCHPVTGKTNAGMYRMQVLGMNTTAMHWQRHKTGAAHFEAWKNSGKRMPVSVTLGGDPVYTYCATAPLPENIDEYILAGFLRKRKVNMVKCLTNDLYVPSDADIVLEGYVEPSEEPVTEGPFGDHTGFYSLSDKYPVFHVTCITHRHDAVFPATIVGIPPQEDAWFAMATERIFLAPIRLAVQPEIIDLHMPVTGVAHNLALVKIAKSFPGQGMKVIGSLSGAGQMMFTKYIVVVSGKADLRNYRELLREILENTDFSRDLNLSKGPLDVLDHCSDVCSFGGKMAVDATLKLPEEKLQGKGDNSSELRENSTVFSDLDAVPFIKGVNLSLVNENIGVLILAANPSEDPGSVKKIVELLQQPGTGEGVRFVIVVDHTVDLTDIHAVAWQLLGNSDPVRDCHIISPGKILIDGTIKYYGETRFPRRWPNVICSDDKTIASIDTKWNRMGFDDFVPSPSLKYNQLVRNGAEEIIS